MAAPTPAGAPAAAGPAPPGWTALRLAGGLLLSAMALIAGILVDYVLFFDRVIETGGMPTPDQWRFETIAPWANPVTVGLLLASLGVSVLAAMRAQGPYRKLALVLVATSAAAAVVFVGTYWSNWSPLVLPHRYPGLFRLWR